MRQKSSTSKHELWYIQLSELPIGLHSVNTKSYDTDTGTGETVPVVSVLLAAKRYLRSTWPNRYGSVPQFQDKNQ